MAAGGRYPAAHAQGMKTIVRLGEPVATSSRAVSDSIGNFSAVACFVPGRKSVSGAVVRLLQGRA